MKKIGNPGLHLQPGWTIDEDEHGLMTGECSWEGDIAYYGAYQTGLLHPYDARLTSYRRRVTRLSADKCRITHSFIGLKYDPTPMFIEHPGGSGQEPIETHPDFTDFAGTPASPKNGAKFDDETGEFIGFTDIENSLAGVRSYIVPSVLATLSYYTHYVPNLAYVARISHFYPPDLIRPPNVRNFLLVGMPYRRIGNLFQVSMQLLGSGPRGWNTKIY